MSFLANLACNAVLEREKQRYLAEAIVRRWSDLHKFTWSSELNTAFARQLLALNGPCPGARDMSESQKRWLLERAETTPTN